MIDHIVFVMTGADTVILSHIEIRESSELPYELANVPEMHQIMALDNLSSSLMSGNCSTPLLNCVLGIADLLTSQAT